MLRLCLAFVAVATVNAQVSDLYCDPTDCNASNPTAAYSLCQPAISDGIFPTSIIGNGLAFSNNQAFTEFCLGFCDDGSREVFFGTSMRGAVWDICSGCDAQVVAEVCSMCNGRGNVGICNTPATPGCTLVTGDPLGDAEEVIGQTTTAEECRDLVALHRPSANGMAWSLNDHDFNGRGRCYAEFNAASINTAASTYSSCIFTTVETTDGFDVQDLGSGSGSGAGRFNGDGEGGNEGGANGGYGGYGGYGGKKGKGMGWKKGSGDGVNYGSVITSADASKQSTLIAGTAACALFLVVGGAWFIKQRRSRMDGPNDPDDYDEVTERTKLITELNNQPILA